MHNTSGSDAVLQLNEIGLTDFHELRVSVGSGQASLSGSTLTIPRSDERHIEIINIRAADRPVLRASVVTVPRF